jgi:hypothetical protein
MDTIRTYIALGIVGAGVFALLVLAPMVLQAQGLDARVNVGATICTMDAMQCPDGSWVGRSGPACEFKCPGAGTSQPVPVATFSASPKSGEAPLTVRFASALSEPEHYTIDFGDGTRAQYSLCAESDPAQCSLSHTYSAPGTYQATLIKDACPEGVVCIWAGETVGKATITVGKHTDNTNDEGGHAHSGEVHASSTAQWHGGWFSWFSNFHFKFWPLWR